jgi:catechol-2,3-dioxygenase
MLGEKESAATIPVRALASARPFYEETLDLEPVFDSTEAVAYKTSGTPLLVYESEYAGTNKATAVTWLVDDVDGAVAQLRDRGVTFEHYDLPGTTLDGDVHVMGEMKAAWFKDPDGNIHSLVTDTR